MSAAAVEQTIQALLAQSVQEGLLDDQFLQLIQLQVRRRAYHGPPPHRRTAAAAAFQTKPTAPLCFSPPPQQDESNPDFVAEVVELYFEDSASKIDTLDARLAEAAPNFQQAHRRRRRRWAPERARRQAP